MEKDVLQNMTAGDRASYEMAPPPQPQLAQDWEVIRSVGPWPPLFGLRKTTSSHSSTK